MPQRAGFTPPGKAHSSDFMKRKPGCAECFRIVLTGGPGGGKTTAADLFRREIGESVVIVPEAATILFQGGFPRSRHAEAGCFAQTAVFHVQRNLEDVQASLFPGRTLLCDRGTVDGAAYWPEDKGDFFATAGTSLEAELKRYDAVIFFETAAIGGCSIEGGNPMRNESLAEAIELDARLRALWTQHPRFTLVPHNRSFFKKISHGLAVLEGLVAQLCGRKFPGQNESNAKGKTTRGRKAIRPICT
jgi:predicted ATPase